MSSQFLNLKRTDSIALVTLDYPPANLLGRQVLTEINSLFQQLAGDPSVDVVVLTGAGRFFCAGADIRELNQLGSVSDALTFSERGQAVLRNIERLNKPVIAAVNGVCLGGGLELAMACHCRIAARGSSFGLPETHLGLIPGFGGTQRLPRLVGPSKAAELILTGETFSADQALQWGLLSQVVDESRAVQGAQALAEKLIRQSPAAIRTALQALRASQESSLDDGLEKEARLFSELIQTPEAQEGMQAFLEKRPPTFSK